MGAGLDVFRGRVAAYKRGNGGWSLGNQLGREILRYGLAHSEASSERSEAIELARELYKTAEERFKGFKNIIEAGEFFGRWGGSKDFAFKVWDREILVFERGQSREVSLRKFPKQTRRVKEGSFGLFEACFERGGSNIYSDMALSPGLGRVYSSGGKRILNLWEGTAAQRLVKRGKCGNYSRILEHIRFIICDGREEEYEFILDWLCAISFRTEQKTGCMPILIGCEGSGKSLFARLCVKLVGEQYSAVIGSGDFRKNNDVFLDSLFIDVEEGKLRRAETEKLKHLITCEAVERKGQMTASHHNFLMTTNDIKPLWGYEMGRRFFELRVNESYGIGRGHDRSRGTYFRNIVSELNSAESLRGFARFLHERREKVQNRIFETDNSIADNHIERKKHFGSVGDWLLACATGDCKIDFLYGIYSRRQLYEKYKDWSERSRYIGSLLSIDSFEKKLDFDFNFVLRNYERRKGMKRYYFPETPRKMQDILNRNGIS